jgi:subtilisin-like proprotein convertase family protein
LGDYTPASGGRGGGSDTFFETTTDVGIPDNSATGERGDLVVDHAGEVATIDIHVDIKHTYVVDLKIEIFAPDGASGVLRDQTGGSANDIDENYSINAGTRDAAGTWQLKVSDHAGTDVGYIDSCSITFE